MALPGTVLPTTPGLIAFQRHVFPRWKWLSRELSGVKFGPGYAGIAFTRRGFERPRCAPYTLYPCIRLTVRSGAVCSMLLTVLRSMVTFGSTISAQFPALAHAL